MIATEAILVIAFCLAVVAVIGIRIALSLADIEKSLNRVAAALENGISEDRLSMPPALKAGAGAMGQDASGLSQANTAQPPSDQELAAAIAAAARYRRAATPSMHVSTRPHAAQAPSTSMDDGNGIVDAAAERI